MKKRRKSLVLIAVVTALLLSCSLTFASQAIVDDETGNYTYPTRFDNCLLIDGVDVSAWQGDSVDWKKVKAHGIDYVFIRIGWTGLDSPFSVNKDMHFETNYKGATEAGLLVGVYHYSCATTVKEAQKEAKFVLDTLDGRELDLPVVFDFEYAGRIQTTYKSKAATTSNILAFLNYIAENSDYEPMFYSYRNIMDPDWSPKFNMELIDSKYKVWIAQYSTDIGYTRPFEFWQYTSSGGVSGIAGNVDCNFWFYDNEAEVTKENTSSIKDAEVTLSKKTYYFNGKERKPSVTVSHGGTPLTAGTDYKVFYIKNVNAGTASVMIQGKGAYSNTKMVDYKIYKANIANGGKLAEIQPQKYKGKAVTVSTDVTRNGVDLKKNQDYTVHYANNKAPGTATITIKGKGNYNGSFSSTFEILGDETEEEDTSATPDPDTAAPEDTDVKMTNEITGLEPAYTVSSDAAPFVFAPAHKGTGPLTYVSSNPAVATVDDAGQVTITGPGTAEITISAAEDEQYQAASITVILTVNPTDADLIRAVKDTTIKASTKTGYGYILLSWNKGSDADVDYYEVYRSKKKGVFSTKPYTKTADGETEVYKNISSLKKNTRYYYRVRGVKKIGGKKYYTKWSNTANRNYTYTGTADINIITDIKSTTLKATSTRGKSYIKVNWKKKGSYKVDYYQICRSTKKNFSSGKVYYKTKTGKVLTYKNTKLTKGKRYYYKVRGVRVVDGKKRFTKWSNVVTRIAK